MIGHATAALEPFPRRWLLRVWGSPHIPTRQKWSAVWPYLSRLSRGSQRLLDAGCGGGMWSLELSVRRPRWLITGIDRAEAAIKAAELARRRLGLGNVRFVHGDFLAFHPTEGFDIVLSVQSAHYLVEEGRGVDLFSAFRAWLKPDGLLILLAPRSRPEVPYSRYLPPPFPLRDVLSFDAIRLLCAQARLEIKLIAPVIGVLGTIAQQLNRAAARSRVLSLLTYPLQLVLAEGDRLRRSDDVQKPSSSWLVVAGRADDFRGVRETSPEGELR